MAKLRLNNWPCKSEVKGAIYHVAIATVIFPHEKLSSCFRSKVHLLFVWCLYNHDNAVEPCLEPRYYGHFFWPGKTAIHFLVKKKNPTRLYGQRPHFKTPDGGTFYNFTSLVQ